MAFVAQMVERKTLNLVVVGSIPIEGVFWTVSDIEITHCDAIRASLYNFLQSSD